MRALLSLGIVVLSAQANDGLLDRQTLLLQPTTVIVSEQRTDEIIKRGHPEDSDITAVLEAADLQKTFQPLHHMQRAIAVIQPWGGKLNFRVVFVKTSFQVVDLFWFESSGGRYQVVRHVSLANGSPGALAKAEQALRTVNRASIASEPPRPMSKGYFWMGNDPASKLLRPMSVEVSREVVVRALGGDVRLEDMNALMDKSQPEPYRTVFLAEPEATVLIETLGWDLRLKNVLASRKNGVTNYWALADGGNGCRRLLGHVSDKPEPDESGALRRAIRLWDSIDIPTILPAAQPKVRLSCLIQ